MQPTLIAVSIGNTTIQVGTTGDAGWPPAWLNRLDLATREFRPEQLEAHLPAGPCCWYVASVHRASETKLASWVQQFRTGDRYQALLHDQLPLEIQVERPERVGMDRLVAAVAANRLRVENRPVIVVDAGTATTVDLIGRDGTFQGGAILPGMQMVARALAADTDVLPQVATRFSTAPPPVGKSTEAAIRSGLFWGAVGAVRELIRRMSLEVDLPPQLLVTGGGAEHLAEHLGDDARFVPDLVLSGIVASVATG